MADRIPLFPLGTVLYPGLVLPLHVFEERYRALVAHLLARPEGEPRRFGVVAIREGREVGADGVRALHEVGCAADVRRVQPYEDGRFDVVTTGGARFRLHAVHDDRPWTEATVTWLGEDPGDAAPVLGRSVGRVFDRYRALLLGAGSGTDDGTDALDDAGQELPTDPRALSYLVSAAAVLDLADKQALLAAPTTSDRLRMALALLRRETSVLAALPSLPAVELTRTPYVPN